MKIASHVVVCAILSQILAPICLAQFPSDRTLTDMRGRHLEVTVLDQSGNEVRIRRKSDGKEFTIPLVSLSDADRIWLKGLRQPVEQPVVKNPEIVNPPSQKATRRKENDRKSPETPTFPPPAVRIPVDEILAAQEASGVVSPPDGRDALETKIRFKDGRVLPGYIYDVRGGQFWYAAADKVQKSGRLDELMPGCRVELHQWREGSQYAGSPLVDLNIDGKAVVASILQSSPNGLLLLTDQGEFMEDVAVESMDAGSRKFLEDWQAERWEPVATQWVIEPKFTSIMEFSDEGFALAMQGGKWGLIDRAGGDVMVPRFDQVVRIKGSPNVKVREGRNWGLLANGSRLVIPPDLEDVDDLHEGLVAVRRDGKWGYAEPGGKLVIPCTWDEAWRFSSAGLAVVTAGGKRGFVDRSGRVIVKPEWDGALLHSPEGIGAVRRGNGWAMIDSSGKLLSEPIWKFKWNERRFELGYITAWLADQPGRRARKTLLGIDGKPGAIPKLRDGVCLTRSLRPQPRQNSRPRSAQPRARLSHADYLRQRAKQEAYRCRAGQPFGKRVEQDQYGLLDPKGNVVLDAEWDRVETSKEHPHIMVCRNEMWGLANPQGKMIIEPVNTRLSVINPGLVMVQEAKNKGKLLQLPDGKAIIDQLVYSASRKLPHGSLLVKVGRSFQCLWPDGTPVVTPGMPEVHYIDHYGKDMIFVEGSKKDPLGWWLAHEGDRTMTKFEGAKRLYWNKSMVNFERIWIEDMSSGDWHFCAIDGKRLGPVMKHRPRKWFMDDGLGVIREDEEVCHFINSDGVRLGSGNWEDARIPRRGMAAVKSRGKWGFVNELGEFKIPCAYEDVGDFFHAPLSKDDRTNALAAALKDGKWGYINPSGKVVIPHVGQQPGRWDSSFRRYGIPGVIRFVNKDEGKYTYSTYRFDGTLFERPRELPEPERKPAASKWIIATNPDGLMGITDAQGKWLLNAEWPFVQWVNDDVAAVRGKYSGGLFSPDKGWLFQDDDNVRLMRNDREAFDRDLLQGGYVFTQKTPKWGYARWKRDAAD